MILTNVAEVNLRKYQIEAQRLVKESKEYTFKRVHLESEGCFGGSQVLRLKGKLGEV